MCSGFRRKFTISFKRSRGSADFLEMLEDFDVKFWKIKKMFEISIRKIGKLKSNFPNFLCSKLESLKI